MALFGDRPWVRIICHRGIGFILLGGLAACAPPDPLATPTQPKEPEQKSQLTLNKATLEQANGKGQTLWKIQVEKGQYTPDGKRAELESIRGDLYENGKVVLKVKADKGEILEDGKTIFLRQNIVAVDPRNNTTLRAQEVEWQGEKALLIARRQLKGEHPELTATATEGRYDTRQQQLTLQGSVYGITELKPKPSTDRRRLELKTDALTWDLKNQQLTGTLPLYLVRFEDKTITDEVRAKQGVVLLKQKLAYFGELNEFKSLKPPLQIATKEMSWAYGDRYVASNHPLKIVDPVRQITVQGNKGVMNFATQFAVLNQGTHAVSIPRQSSLFADQLTYGFNEQWFEALGNVIYEQQKGMKFNLTGDRATGSLYYDNVVVTSNNPERVVTEIFPQTQP